MSGQEVYSPLKKTRERVARILRMHANKRERIEQARAGDIIGIIGLKSSTTGDTLTDPEHPIILEAIDVYEPVLSLAIEPKTSGQQDKIIDVLGKMAEEDPTFHFRLDEDSGQTVISGMGELHLEVLVHRLEREYNLAVNIGKPQVVYRETIRQAAEVEEVFDRELGGVHHQAQVNLQLIPNPRGEGNLFMSLVPEEEIPATIVEAIRSAVNESCTSGVLQGYPVVDIKVILTKARTTESQFSEMAFRVAASMAFRNGCQQGPTGTPGADHAIGNHRPRRILGGSDRRPQQSQRENRKNHSPEKNSAGPGDGPAFADVRLFHGSAVGQPGSGHLHHALFTLQPGIFGFRRRPGQNL